MDSRRSSTVKTIPQHQFTDLRVVLTKYIYHWPLFIMGIAIASAGAYLYLYSVNPVYEVSATILVKDEKKSPQQEKSVLPELDQTSSPKNAETEIEILKSKKLINEVVNQLQLWVSYKDDDDLKKQDLYESSPVKFSLIEKTGSMFGQKVYIQIKDKSTFLFKNANGQMQPAAFNMQLKSAFGTWTLKPTPFTDQYIGSNLTINLNDADKVANDYVKTIDAHLLDKLAPTIGLFITDEVPQRGINFLDNLIQAYNQAASEEEKRTTKGTIDFIDNRLASLTGELSHAEKNVEGYRSSQGITDISSQSKVYLENVQTNGLKLNDVNIQLQIIDGIERYINSTSENASAPATIGITDPALNSLVEKLSELQLKKSALLATTPEGNPMFEPLNKQISLTKTSIRQIVQGIKSSLLNSKQGLQSFGNKSESSIKDIPGQERQFVDMKRQQSIKENLYVYLLQKREELALSYASTFVDARVVDNANVGDVTWPRKPFVFAVALLLGLSVPFMIIYFRNSFNNKISERREIENALNVPVLGELSYKDLDGEAIVVTNRHHLLGEQFRALRTNLHYAHTKENSNHATHLNGNSGSLNVGNSYLPAEGRVTLFTSSVSKEGKSFVSVNVAASLAASGRKTVVLEMDLRKPKITKIFRLKNDQPGISEFLSSHINVDYLIRPIESIPNLDFIGCGQIPIDPSELLENGRLAELISELKDRYDDIIIDSPPLHLVTDAMIIAKLADLSVYIIRQGFTGKNELDFIHEIEQNQQLPNMYIVFNGIKKNKYGYGYNYDNSYYSNDKDKRSFKTAWKQFASRF
jgi:tyrosine-protein kinase Etk/Wzc